MKFETNQLHSIARSDGRESRCRTTAARVRSSDIARTSEFGVCAGETWWKPEIGSVSHLRRSSSHTQEHSCRFVWKKPPRRPEPALDIFGAMALTRDEAWTLLCD